MPGTGDEQPAEEKAPEAARAELRSELFEAAPLARFASVRLESLASPERRIAVAKAKQAEQANRLRVVYGVVLLAIMLIQVAGADYLFYRYASSKAIQWTIPVATINVWMSATVV